MTINDRRFAQMIGNLVLSSQITLVSNNNFRLLNIFAFIAGISPQQVEALFHVAFSAVYD
jgi:hypothetical protein